MTSFVAIKKKLNFISGKIFAFAFTTSSTKMTCYKLNLINNAKVKESIF